MTDYLQNDNYLFSDEDNDYQKKLVEKLQNNDEENLKIDIDFDY